MSGLGIDAGGTQTRWALADGQCHIIAEGAVAGLSATQLGDAAGRAHLMRSFAAIAQAAHAHTVVTQVQAALTGFDAAAQDTTQLAELIAAPCALAPAAITVMSDIEAACRAAFAPGDGYLVYSGTGSVAAFVDQAGILHRAGGRGMWLDDGGSGTWIAREALRAVWRREDEAPGSWRDSKLAQELFTQLGGDEWRTSRQLILAADRGQIGQLALAVARAAQENNPQALTILQDAGLELARLANAMITRFGPRNVVLSGRAAALHPCIARTVARSLPRGALLIERTIQTHHAAARWAAAPTMPVKAASHA
ncbi:MAG: N-acetylglucosamine kinase [Burkholderiaceae bacterium]